MEMKRYSKVIPVLVILLATLGCLKKPAGGAITPWERVTAENAILAQLVKTATQGTIAVNQSQLITDQQTAPVLGFYSQAATIQEQITAILAVAPTSANIPQIQALVSQIGASATALIDNGALGVKNPNSQQLIGADVQAIVSSINTILSSYQAAVGGH